MDIAGAGCEVKGGESRNFISWTEIYFIYSMTKNAAPFLNRVVRPA
jgi:hypothetical protein